MAKVRKKNRLLTVSDQAVESYLKRGYDQVDNDGNILKKATGGKKVALNVHNKVLKELEELKRENTELKKQLKVEKPAEGKKKDKK